jgi:ADP-ribose pyrophosphatase
MLEKYFSLLRDYPYLFRNEGALLKIITDIDVISEWETKKCAELQSKGLPEEWAKIGVLVEDPYVILIRDLVEFPDGTLGGYVRLLNRADLSGGQGVAVIACMDGKILLLHQFRHATRSWHLEIPRGFGEPGISAMEQAINEIREEVDGQIGELKSLGIVHNNTGMEGQSVGLFFAHLLSVGQPSRQEGIDKYLWVSSSELGELIHNGKITDGFTIVAYTRAKLAGLI